MSARPPFTEPTERDEWEYTTAARIMCESCSEWIYTRRRRGTNGPHALPPVCQVCGATTPRGGVSPSGKERGE